MNCKCKNISWACYMDLKLHFQQIILTSTKISFFLPYALCAVVIERVMLRQSSEKLSCDVVQFSAGLWIICSTLYIVVASFYYNHTVSNKNAHLTDFETCVFHGYLRNHLSYKKVIYIYLHPFLKSFQMKKEFFKCSYKISWYLQKRCFARKK